MDDKKEEVVIVILFFIIFIYVESLLDKNTLTFFSKSIDDCYE